MRGGTVCIVTPRVKRTQTPPLTPQSGRIQTPPPVAHPVIQ